MLPRTSGTAEYKILQTACLQWMQASLVALHYQPISTAAGDCTPGTANAPPFVHREAVVIRHFWDLALRPLWSLESHGLSKVSLAFECR